jgi:hypothetical protein
MLQVAILSGLTFGTAVLFLGFITTTWGWGTATIFGLLFAALQILLYWLLLRKSQSLS